MFQLKGTCGNNYAQTQNAAVKLPSQFALQSTLEQKSSIPCYFYLCNFVLHFSHLACIDKKKKSKKLKFYLNIFFEDKMWALAPCQSVELPPQCRHPHRVSWWYHSDSDPSWGYSWNCPLSHVSQPCSLLFHQKLARTPWCHHCWVYRASPQKGSKDLKSKKH